MREAPAVLIAVYQNLAPAKAVFHSLRSAGFHRAALLHIPPATDDSPGHPVWRKGPAAPRVGDDREFLERLPRLVVPGESLVIVEPPHQRMVVAHEMLSGGEGEHPLVFSLPQVGIRAEAAAVVVPSTTEELTLRASEMGRALSSVSGRSADGESPWARLRASERALHRADASLSRATGMEMGVALSAEWLLDNGYIIQGHIEDVRRNLPHGFFRHLSAIESGPHAGRTLPDVLASEIARLTDARLDRENMQVYLQSFQTETPLTMAELWALPQMFRLALIEHLAVRSASVVRRERESEAADFWANRLFCFSRRAPGRLSAVAAELARAVRRPSAHFAEELTQNLYDEEAALQLVRGWLEAELGGPLNEILRHEQHIETAEQVSLANAITSLRFLSQLDWRVIFEAVSRVDAILWGDPAGIYGVTDFATRDEYRHVVERIARRTGRAEEEVARAAVELSLDAEGLARHVGYFLVDDGLERLRERFAYRGPIRERLAEACRRHGWRVYGVAIFLVAAGVWFSCLGWMGARHPSEPVFLLLGALLFLPSIEIAVEVVNYLASRLMAPRPLPKMRYERGIPDDCRTLVVVPTILSDPEGVREEVGRLHVRSLANPDANLRFALLSDYADAHRERQEEDEAILHAAVEGIQALNESYGSVRFLLFHRERVWCRTERRWMGWERKRGKIEQLNRLLCGETAVLAELPLRVGSIDDLVGVRYVITLDSDTQLPRDTAARLVETISHPLNRAVLSPDGRSVTRGYTVIQPRASATLPSATATRFSRLFSNPVGIDPYTSVVSDVYQDLAGQASYQGKGIYDVQAFHSVLSGRFPESHLLSHDLIEGEHVRTGLASDIELLELFPSDYRVYCGREHRWVRGDWQIVDWLLPWVPDGNGRRTRNPLNGLSRWKILDNLRRSVTPLSRTLLLAVGCLIAPIPEICAVLVALGMLAPAILQLSQRLTQRWKLDPMVYREPAVNVARAGLYTAILPHQAMICLDAIIRVAYRRLISHRFLLEWQSFHASRRQSDATRRWLVASMGWLPVFAVGMGATLIAVHPHAVFAILPFGLLWLASPFLIGWMGRTGRPYGVDNLRHSERTMLRQVARQTWRFFDTFVGPDTHWLPPDNFQAKLRVEIAQRTSPTNIGLWLLANLAAHDFGYVTGDDVVRRASLTFQTLDHLARHEGHLLNWYDTETLEPLGQPYVSMVDSGNLIGALWAFRQALAEIASLPIVDRSAFSGMSDCLALLCHAHGAERRQPPALHEAVIHVERLLDDPPSGLEQIIRRLRALMPAVQRLSEEIGLWVEADEECRYWAGQLVRQAAEWNGVVERYLSWVDLWLDAPPERAGDPEWRRARREALGRVPSLSDIAKMSLPSDRSATGGRGQAAAREQLDRIQSLVDDVDDLDFGMRMDFLYDSDRRHFATGYNAAERRLDRSYYDLLASEARLGSFIAIARGDTPAEHWWSLGRPFGLAYLHRPLLSWNGTMFEYLMPLLLNRRYANSLLDQSCVTAVVCQRAYGRQRGIPWGISEAAFSGLDARQVYQYRAFGVPGLGIKRGLEDDLVVAPYATALALAVDPRGAAENLHRLSHVSRGELRGPYGFFESIDYSRHHGPHGERGVVVSAYMAHHQGMILAAIDNALHENVLQERFHADPRVRATESLLFERVPIAPPLVKNYSHESAAPPLAPVAAAPAPGRIDTPDTPSPRAHLLSNGTYHLMVTNAGGGYSRWKDIELTRWRADTTRDCWGTFAYLKDVDSGRVWSAAYQPVCGEARRYHATFAADKVDFRRRDDGMDTLTEIVVCPEDSVEVRRITLTNRTDHPRRIQVTSYAELALAPHNADRAHPAFNKLFIETEALPDLESLLAWRRPRSPEEEPVFAFHTVAVEHQTDEPAQYETDRGQFLGRGNAAADPSSLSAPLSGTAGYVIDPIFSLRRTVTVAPNQHAHVCFVTGAASTREAAVALAGQYRDPQASQRAVEAAWTHAQLEMRHFRIQPDDAQLYQQLASYILYPHSHLRAPAARIRRNVHGQSRLWAYGISGDLPIVAVTISEQGELDVAREALQAHTFWRAHGLKVDLVLLNEEPSSYEQPLQAELSRLVAAHSMYTGMDQPGGVFLRPSASIPEEDMTLILSAARLVLVGARGPLAQQASVPSIAPRRAGDQVPTWVDDTPAIPLPFLELPYFNGLGGFTPDGREYAIYLGPDDETPAPWTNVLANPGFGALVTESGGGSCWSGNSQMNRLTAWSNDPVSNRPADAIYIRDNEMGLAWTPTPLPIRESDAYRTRHSQGYSRFEHNSHGIEQLLTVFVPVDDAGGDPVRIQILRLVNRSSRPRYLTVTSYAEWTLGVDREETQLHVSTGWDAESEALFVRNAYRPDFGGCLAFAAADGPISSYTADRTEFLGRNGSPASPAGLRHATLSGRTGPGLDPCAAMRIDARLEPGEERTFVFLLGEATDADAARELIANYRTAPQAEEALQRTIAWWDRFLSAVRVKTPDMAVDLLLNRWLLYQALACRLWGRSAFYQSGGAFGFRDQLQDSLALLYAAPGRVRDQILLSASRQFPEGDVQHWWHPPSGAGVRTRISDDLLWLPFVTAQYVRVTGDLEILDAAVPFLEGRALAEDEKEAYFAPQISAESATLLEHCRRSITRASAYGPHGLPLMGSGDWNDGMNLVGAGGQGESVWLAWFLIHCLKDFAEMLRMRGDEKTADEYALRAANLAAKVEETAWDGEWYLRAFFDDGTSLGSHLSDQAAIDSLPQSWAVLSGAGQPSRAERAMKAILDRLVRRQEGMIRLFDPPFDGHVPSPGYIQGYPPGVRENGGQYTHGSLWSPMAFARMGRGKEATELLRMLNPVEHARTPEEVARYRVEPYVVAADIYALPGQVGRGGWTWYTGSAGWMYRIWIEEVLGLKVRGNRLSMDPVVHPDWPGYEICYRYGASTYRIVVENPEGVERGVRSVELDGMPAGGGVVLLADDGEEHRIAVGMGSTNTA